MDRFELTTSQEQNQSSTSENVDHKIVNYFLTRELFTKTIKISINLNVY
jgi:hypothetical protein